MTAVTLVDLIAKRHEGSGWHVFTELPNGTGGRSTRRADAVALGLWPSHKYEIHGYEIKHDRGDVRRELQDIAKSHAIGRFCDYWSLVVSDMRILKDLLIPPTWGVLVPYGEAGKLGTQSRLRVERKPTRRKATPITRAFVAAMFQHMGKSWVSRATHTRVIQDARDELAKVAERVSMLETPATTGGLKQLQDCIARFEQESGVSLASEGGRYAPWLFGDIGAAVRVVLAAQAQRSGTARDVRSLEIFASNVKGIAERAANEAAAMRAVLEMKHAPQEATAEQDTSAAPSTGADVDCHTEQVQAP